MANLESQSTNQLGADVVKPKFLLDSVLTPEEQKSVWCALASMTVYADRRNQDQVGQPLSDLHKRMLADNCGEVDFGKWVTEDETNRDANHRAMERLKAKNPLPID